MQQTFELNLINIRVGSCAHKSRSNHGTLVYLYI